MLQVPAQGPGCVRSQVMSLQAKLSGSGAVMQQVRPCRDPIAWPGEGRGEQDYANRLASRIGQRPVTGALQKQGYSCDGLVFTRAADGATIRAAGRKAGVFSWEQPSNGMPCGETASVVKQSAGIQVDVASMFSTGTYRLAQDVRSPVYG